MRARLFCYGSLTYAPIMRAVLGRLPSACRATMPGYTCIALAGEPYPALVPCNGTHVQGVVYLGLSPGSLRLLDNYEGELYRRVRVRPTLADGTRLEAWTYVLGMRYYHRKAHGRWSMQRFIARHSRVCLHRL